MPHRQHFRRRFFRSSSSLVITAVMAGSLAFLGAAPAMAADDPGATTSTTPETSTTPDPGSSTVPSESPESSATGAVPQTSRSDSAKTAPTATDAVTPDAVASLATSFAPRCAPGYVYSVTAAGDLRQVVNGGQSTSTGVNFGSATSYNGLGIAKDGAKVYAYARSNSWPNQANVATIVQYDSATGSKTTLSTNYQTDLNGALIAGAVDLKTGDYYFGGYEEYKSPRGDTFKRLKIWRYSQAKGQVEFVGSANTTIKMDAANGDFAFDAQGNLYALVSSRSSAAIVSITAATLASAGGGSLANSQTTTLTLSGAGENANGIAFDGDGSIYLGTGDGLYRYNAGNWSSLGSYSGVLSNSTDLSSCNTPATLTLKKNVQGRVADTDQFQLTLKTGAAVSATATTEGTAAGIQAQQAGPFPAVVGTTYTFSEEKAGTTDLANYASSYTCTDESGTTLANGQGTTGNVVIPQRSGAAVVCTITNTPKSVSVVVSKVWVVNGQTFANGSQPQGLSAQLQLTGPTGSSATDQAWGVPRAGYAWGASATVSEKTTIDPALVGCRVTDSKVTKVNGAAVSAALPYGAKLDRSATSVEVTNTVSCVSTLDLVKKVSFGSADPSAWTLAGTPGSGPSVSGTSGVSAVVTPGTAYVLSESGGPATYAQQGQQWSCALATGTDTDGKPVYGAPSAASSATVPFGKRMQCTVTNATAKLTVLKHVSNTNGGSLTADQWSLTSTPKPGVSGLSPATFDGSEQPTAVNTFEVLPGHVYAVTESPKTGAPAYLQTKVQAYTGDPSQPVDQADASKWKDVDGSQITTDAGKQQIVRIVNADVASPVLPITGAEMGQLALWTGGGLALAALAVLAWMIHRRRHDGTGLLDD